MSVDFIPSEYSMKMFWSVTSETRESGKSIATNTGYMRAFFPLCGEGFELSFYPHNDGTTGSLIFAPREAQRITEDHHEAQSLIKIVEINLERSTFKDDFTREDQEPSEEYFGRITFCDVLYEIDVITPALEFGRAKKGCFGTFRIRKA